MRKLEDIIANEDYVTDRLRQICKKLTEVGPLKNNLIEELTYINLYHPSIVNEFVDSLVMRMGLFYKKPTPKSFTDFALDIYSRTVTQENGVIFTPVQKKIYSSINNESLYTFSAPTSVGKSYVLRSFIDDCNGDVLIVVPTRSLMNEYIITLKQRYKNSKEINILRRAEIINTKNSAKNIFVLTPERAREVFALRTLSKIELVMLDEAQLSEDDSVRGLNFDGIVRRLRKRISNAKMVFIHPFVANPEAQLIKHRFEYGERNFNEFEYKSMGQLFFSKNEKWEFSHEIMFDWADQKKYKIDYDPIEDVIKNDGSVLIYGSKQKVVDNSLLNKYEKYLKMIPFKLTDDALEIIEQVANEMGVDVNSEESQMVFQMKRGIVLHHGSLPLDIRILIEEFVQRGFAKVCLSTSTLSQGINMPFDMVILERMEGSKLLDVRNVIGRAGRTTTRKKFDTGLVVINESRVRDFRKLMSSKPLLRDSSFLDVKLEKEYEDEDYLEFKEAINEEMFDDELHLPFKAVDRVSTKDIQKYCKICLGFFFKTGEFKVDSGNGFWRLMVTSIFRTIYEAKIGRGLVKNELKVFEQSIYILYSLLRGQNLESIAKSRLKYADKSGFLVGYKQLPNKRMRNYNLFAKYPMSYDITLCDAYDYIDKSLGYTLIDVFVASFAKYGEISGDERASELINRLKYFTNDEKTIWLKRYGFSDTEIETLYEYVERIDEESIQFIDEIYSATEEVILSAQRYLYCMIKQEE